MKFKIVFYLFLFVCVILFFQLINTNKILNHQDRLIQNQNSLQLQLKDSIASFKQTLSLQKYFSVDEKQSAELKTLKTELMSLNVQGGLEKLVKVLPLEERFLIDAIQQVNSEWILIGFRSSSHWGQALLSYTKTPKGFKFRSLASTIHPL